VSATYTRRMFWSALMLAATLVGSECLARVIWSEVDLVMNPVLSGFRDHPTLLWLYRPNAEWGCDGCPTIRTNALGLRGPDPQPVGDRPALRVLSLGESTTFGAFVEEHQTYSAVLQQLLRTELEPAGCDVQVINAGVEGWSVWQSRTWLEQEGMALEPDLVLVYHLLNDHHPSGVVDENNYLYKVDGTDRELLDRRKRFGPLFGLLLQSRAYLALRRAVLDLPTDLPVATGRLRPSGGQRVPLPDRRAAFAHRAGVRAERATRLQHRPTRHR
jgi:hypothetical protein